MTEGAKMVRANAHGASGDCTPLIEHVCAGNGAMVVALLDAGANPNARDKKGKTALSIALEKGHTNIAHRLKEETR